MTNILFAMVKNGSSHEVRRVPVTAQVQSQLDQLFEHQERTFLADVSEDIPFDGMYKPDKEELLYIDDADLTAPLHKAISLNASAFPILDVGSLSNSRIQFLFRKSTLQYDRILLQRFTSRQYLSNSALAVILRSGTYEKLVDPGFSFDDKVSAHVVGSRVYFRSFFQLRAMLTVQDHLTEATTPQLESFADHDSLRIENKALFMANSDQTCRRLVGSIQRSDVLNIVTPQKIVERALEVGLELNLSDGKILIPSDKAKMKLALRFLEQSVFRGVLTEEVFMSNSKRLVN